MTTPSIPCKYSTCEIYGTGLIPLDKPVDIDLSNMTVTVFMECPRCGSTFEVSFHDENAAPRQIEMDKEYEYRKNWKGNY